MSAIGAAAVILALGYLAVTLVFQFRPLSAWFPELDQLGVLPRWKFFTQNNGVYDLGVEVQDRRANGSLGDWSPIAAALRGRAWNSLWFPRKYRAAAFRRAADTLERRAMTGKDASPETSLAYALILNHCRDVAPRSGDAEARRFALVRMRGAGEGGERWVVFTSDFHTF
jgi:hypothetical protein